VTAVPAQRELVEIRRLLEDRLQVAVAEHRQDQLVVVLGGKVEQGGDLGPVVLGAGEVAGRHEEDPLHVRGEDRLLVPGEVVREPYWLALPAGEIPQATEEELGVDRRVDRLRVEETRTIGSPPLRLVPVAVAGSDDVLVDEPRTVGSVPFEARDADVGLAVTTLVGVPVERGPRDVVAVGGPVGVEVVMELGVVGQVGALRAVARHHPDVGAQTTEAGTPDGDRMAAPGVKENPLPVRLNDRDLVRSLEPAGEADLLRTVEGRAVDLDLPVPVLVADHGVLPDDVLLVEPVHRLPEHELVGFDNEPPAGILRQGGGEHEGCCHRDREDELARAPT
jgi:hypothetical protein